MDYSKIAEAEQVDRLAQALGDKGYLVDRVESKEKALEKIVEVIPHGASVTNGSSTTLQQIGYVDYLKNGTHGWENLHEVMLKEKDQEKQSLLRKQMTVADYYLGSVHALVENGEFVVGSNTASQLPSLAFNASNLVLVVGLQKVVLTLDEAMRRLEEYVVPKEDERSKVVYGVGTQLNKVLIFKGEGGNSGRKIRLILVNEVLGF